VSTVRATFLSPLARGATVAALLGTNLVVSLLLDRRPGLAIAIVALPVILLLVGALASGDRGSLVFVALATPMSFHVFNIGHGIGGGSHVYTSDIVVFLALGAWLGAYLLRGGGPDAPRWPKTPVVGLPLLLFAPPLLIAILRGHSAYGASLLGQPMRLLIYVGIAAAVVDLEPRRAYRGIVAIFYVGTVWMLLNGAYYIATGTSQTDQVDLSTGGSRILSISVSLYMAGALFLALLNLEIDKSARRRLLHLAIAVLALVGVVLGYGRAAYGGVVLVVLLFMFRRHIRGAVLSIVPLALPFLLAAGFALPHLAPSIVPDFLNRVSADQSQDANLQWRVKANEAVWRQVHESPLIGVGFGRMTSFTFTVVTDRGLHVSMRDRIGQDPHNGFLYILAGGGLVTLLPFLAVIAAFSIDAYRRLRSPLDQIERVLVIWSCATLFVFLLNALSGTEFESATDLLTIWILLLLPSIVGRRAGSRPESPRAAR
jgi:O-antigen ligase